MFTSMKIVSVTLVFGMASTAYAELETISDGELSTVTAQRGLTIDYSGQMSLGEFRYEDSGEYIVNDIRSGGAGITDAGSQAGYGTNFDNARLTFDVADDGGMDILWQGQDGSAIDYGFEVGRVAVRSGGTGPATRIFNGIEGWGLLQTYQHSVVPATESGIGKSMVYSYAAFTLEDLSSASAPRSIGLDGVYVKSPDFIGNSVDDMDLTDQIPQWGSVHRARATTALDDIRAGFAASEYSVYAVSAAEAGTPNDTLQINISGFAADVGAQAISVGRMDMGRMTLDNLQISDTIVTLTP